VIIAIDLDAFYVAACRKRDPSLENLPVAIKQKHIVATCSYEARALGVKKLALIRDAVRQCPDLILVNGEDLSYFRKVSSEIFHLVSRMVKGGLVEKLGMDELFCDVTQMVDDLMADLHNAEAPYGIIVPQSTAEVLAGTGGQIAQLETMTQRLLLGTQIAHRIRQAITEQVGLTSSAGISTSKYLAKLVGNTNKPNKQTCLAPLHLASAQEEVQRFLNPFPVRSLNGFGSAITAKMCETAIKTMGLPEQAASTEKMTVLVAREIFDWVALQGLFGDRLADRLVGLLNGIDDDPVVRAPEFPAQISIEDTYQGLDFIKVPEQFYVLSNSLLRRLETELLSTPAKAEPKKDRKDFHMVERPYDAVGDPLKDAEGASMFVREYDQTDEERPISHASVDRQAWKRYPLTMRLSVRQGYTNRVSRQARMPVEIFDLSVSRDHRARKLAGSCESLFRTIIAQDGNKGQGLHLINIAALDLSVYRPATSIGEFFHATQDVVSRSSSAHPFPTSASLPPVNVDVKFLLELPDDIRAEVAEEYGINLHEFIAASQEMPEHAEALMQDAISTSQQSQRAAMTPSTAIECSHCRKPMLSWLQHDHDRWPGLGVPAEQASFLEDDGLDELSWLDETDELRS
jgi:DNA polymerase iota